MEQPVVARQAGHLDLVRERAEHRRHGQPVRLAGADDRVEPALHAHRPARLPRRPPWLEVQNRLDGDAVPQVDHDPAMRKDRPVEVARSMRDEGDPRPQQAPQTLQGLRAHDACLRPVDGADARRVRGAHVDDHGLDVGFPLRSIVDGAQVAPPASVPAVGEDPEPPVLRDHAVQEPHDHPCHELLETVGYPLEFHASEPAGTMPRDTLLGDELIDLDAVEAEELFLAPMFGEAMDLVPDEVVFRLHFRHP